eukprot:1141668-Pelagomonas_calceolata.AAC.2
MAGHTYALITSYVQDWRLQHVGDLKESQRPVSFIFMSSAARGNFARGACWSGRCAWNFLLRLSALILIQDGSRQHWHRP